MAAPVTHSVEIRYLEVDQQGVVFNMWYLAYLDDAMGTFLEARGLPYTDMQNAGYDVRLVHTELDWTAGLRFGPRVEIDVDLEAVGRTSFTLSFVVRQDGRPTCTARTVYVCVDPSSGVKQPVPALVLRALTGDTAL
jgi:acyl-CoA thioester hydrolase